MRYSASVACNSPKLDTVHWVSDSQLVCSWKKRLKVDVAIICSTPRRSTLSIDKIVVNVQGNDIILINF